MKTMKRLCQRFERLHEGCTAELDELESYPGYYRIGIFDWWANEFCMYTFKTCKEFKDWTDNVLM